MQLSLFNASGLKEKKVFLDVFAKMQCDGRARKPVLRTISGQQVPLHLKVKCQKNRITTFPEGTIFKLDVRLVTPSRQSPYLTAIRNSRISRAIEFFDYNLTLQKSGPTEIKQKLRKDKRPKQKAVHPVIPRNIPEIPFTCN